MASDQDVNLILGGFQSASQGLAPLAREQLAERERARPLSPYEKWLGKAMSGQLDVQTAATNAKLEAQGHTIPDTSPGIGQQGAQIQPMLAAQATQQPVPQYGYSPNNVGLSASAIPQAEQQPQLQQGMMSQVSGQSTPPIPSGMLAPETAGDMQSLLAAHSFLPRKPSMEEMEFRRWQEEQRNNRSAASNQTKRDEGAANRGSREQISQQRIDFARDQLKQHWDETILRLQNRLQAVQMARTSGEKIALLKAMIQDYNGAERTTADILNTTPYLAQDQAAREEVYNNRARAFDLRKQADQMYQDLSRQQPQKSSSSIRGSVTAPAVAPPSIDEVNALFGK